MKFLFPIDFFKNNPSNILRRHTWVHHHFWAIGLILPSPFKTVKHRLVKRLITFFKADKVVQNGQTPSGQQIDNFFLALSHLHHIHGIWIPFMSWLDPGLGALWAYCCCLVFYMLAILSISKYFWLRLTNDSRKSISHLAIWSSGCIFKQITWSSSPNSSLWQVQQRHFVTRV